MPEHHEISRGTDPTPHPYALMFPPMGDAAFDALVDSIRRYGLREPIIVNARNQIIDGLNRYRACLKLGIRPKYDRRDISDDDSLIIVINNNVHRRHLSEAQRAAVAALVRKTKPANLPLTQEAAARMFNVSVRSIRSAESVMALSPELYQLIVADKMSVNAAENAAKLPEKDRAQAIALVSDAVLSGREKAKRPRGLPNSASPPAWKRKARPSKHGAYAEIFGALYELPQLLVDHPLSQADATELLDELRRASILLESGASTGAHNDASRQGQVDSITKTVQVTEVMAMTPPIGFERHTVFDRYAFFVGRLPPNLDELATTQAEELWNLHPAAFHEVRQPFTGRIIPLPRWQQAFGKDYRYTGTINRALQVPDVLSPFLAWVREAIDPRLNGLLVNWYDAEKRHYIGAHHDSDDGLVVGAPIVTISLGEERTFRLRVPKKKGFVDFPARHGSVFVMPWETNLGIKHEVPHSAKAKGRRISITARAFKDEP